MEFKSTITKQFELKSGAVICEHYNQIHTLYYRPQRLQDICVNHYIKRYMTVDRTELNRVPNWHLFVGGRYEEELNFVMLLCKENVGE
ncbi:nonstructural protein 3 [Duck-associated ambidensovirus 2]|uniref:Nonstructural protein 3 n=1 Tax=Duck-associated ambidensovirus 1 TaxID=2810799 RepID=A0A891F032_9VIRU|nr:nonstructural protein 3 [Duck-associated ambidensovirus 1]QRK03668.1 nonstructural protein 3 [Duck-associated ambidensovirus 1]QRK03672.1 nonstructural protein 3 [Duck-associated ambidensovirus 2]